MERDKDNDSGGLVKLYTAKRNLIDDPVSAESVKNGAKHVVTLPLFQIQLANFLQKKRLTNRTREVLFLFFFNPRLRISVFFSECNQRRRDLPWRH